MALTTLPGLSRGTQPRLLADLTQFLSQHLTPGYSCTQQTCSWAQAAKTLAGGGKVAEPVGALWL